MADPETNLAKLEAMLEVATAAPPGPDGVMTDETAKAVKGIAADPGEAASDRPPVYVPESEQQPPQG